MELVLIELLELRRLSHELKTLLHSARAMQLKRKSNKITTVGLSMTASV